MITLFIEWTDKEMQDSVTMQKGTKFRVFKVFMDRLEVSDGKVSVLVIENFICDKVGGKITKGEIEQAIGETLEAFSEVVKGTAKRLPQKKILFLEPMSRVAV